MCCVCDGGRIADLSNPNLTLRLKKGSFSVYAEEWNDCSSMQCRSSCMRKLCLLSLALFTAVGTPTSSIQDLALTARTRPEDLAAWTQEWTQVAQGLQEHCSNVAHELKAFRKDGNNAAANQMALGPEEPSELLSTQQAAKPSVDFERVKAVLSGLQSIESSAQRMLSAISGVAGVAKNATCADGMNAEKSVLELPATKDKFIICVLGVLGKAHSLLGVDDASRALSALQASTIKDAESNLDNSNVQWGLGLYFSDVGLASDEGSGSSDAWWERDYGGASAPPQIVRAETLLQESQLAADSILERKNRAATRAMRLYQHADFMARKQHTAAAVWRYRSAAKLAAGSRRSRMPMHGLEMHALTRLAFFLDRSGKDEEALAAANEALAVQHTAATSRIPLAKFLQATLRRRLGELKTDEQVLEAEMQLLAVKGKLPSQALEEERSVAHADFVMWRNIAETPAWSLERFQRCVEMSDGARIFICLLCSAIFP